MKGGGREAGFGFKSFIGEIDNVWRDDIDKEMEEHAPHISYTAFERS